MNRKTFVALAAVASLSLGCVGMGLTVSPTDGVISLEFKARDCISDNVAGRTLSAVPVVGDWAMLNWGCSSIADAP